MQVVHRTCKSELSNVPNVRNQLNFHIALTLSTSPICFCLHKDFIFCTLMILSLTQVSKLFHCQTDELTAKTGQQSAWHLCCRWIRRLNSSTQSEYRRRKKKLRRSVLVKHLEFHGCSTGSRGEITWAHGFGWVSHTCSCRSVDGRQLAAISLGCEAASLGRWGFGFASFEGQDLRIF